MTIAIPLMECGLLASREFVYPRGSDSASQGKYPAKKAIQKMRPDMIRRAPASVWVSTFPLGVMALFIVLSSPVLAQTTGKVTEARHRVDIPSDVVVKERHISLLKFALNLRPEQEPFWAPVEAALHDMARWQASSDLDATGRAASAVVLRLKRIAALAVPLIKALDDSQRRNMMMLARSAGLEMLVASK